LWVAGSTYEGDNIVMLLQTARSLVKAVRSQGNTSSKSNNVTAYIFERSPTSKSLLDERFCVEDVLEAYEHVARRVIHEAVDTLDKYEATQRREDAWDRCAVQLSQSAKAHVRAFIIKTFADAVERAPDASLKRVLRILFELYSLGGILARTGIFLEDGFMSKQQMEYIRQRVVQLLAEIRPMAVQIVDAFDFRDRELKSVLGRYDGNVYENLYKWARESPLNQQEVLDSVKKYLLPMMAEARSKL